MYLNPARQQEVFSWLDGEWKSYKEDSHFSQDMEIFLDIVRSFASSTENAYIDAWYERYQQTQQKIAQTDANHK